MIALLVMVASAVVYVAVVTKILDVQLKQAHTHISGSLREIALAPEEPVEVVPSERAEPTLFDDLDDMQVGESDQPDGGGTRSRLGASSRLLLILLVMGAAVSIAIVLLVGWLSKVIASALS